eukprot:9034855-Ditylum_brightwellii.AAC.1
MAQMKGCIVDRQSSFVNDITANVYWQADFDAALPTMICIFSGISCVVANLALPSSQTQYSNHQYVLFKDSLPPDKPFANTYQGNSIDQSM